MNHYKPTPAQYWMEPKGRQLENVKLGSDQMSNDLGRSELAILHSIFLGEVGACTSPRWSLKIPSEGNHMFGAPHSTHLSELNLTSLQRSKESKGICELSNAISLSNTCLLLMRCQLQNYISSQLTGKIQHQQFSPLATH